MKERMTKVLESFPWIVYEKESIIQEGKKIFEENF